MNKLLHFLFYSCKKATLLIEMSQKMPLSLINGFKLKIHLKICDQCSEYKKQSVFIERVLKSNYKDPSELKEVKLSDSSKARFQKSLEEKMKNN